MRSMWLTSKRTLVDLPSECKKLIFVNALFQGGRLFVGAICVLYFLSFGFQSSDYAWIKTTQAIIFIGLDIPLGYLLTRFGDYKSLLLSFTFGVIGSLGYLLFKSFLGFLISEAFLALSLSIWPVALSSYSMRILENYKVEGLVEKFFHVGDAFSNFFILICGSLGGLLYVFNRHIPYELFLFFYIFAISFTLFYLKDFGIDKIKKKENDNIIRSNFKELKSIFSFASFLFLTQFIMQPLFHYWQPFFREKFTINSMDISLIFVVYSLTMSVISLLYSRIAHLSILRSNLFIIISATIGGWAYILIAKFDNFSFSLFFFALSFGVLNLVQIAVGVLIQNKIDHENRMVITKYVSFYSRLGMIASLILLNWLFNNGWKTSEIFKLYGFMAIITFFIYLVWWVVVAKNIRKKYALEFMG